MKLQFKLNIYLMHPYAKLRPDRQYLLISANSTTASLLFGFSDKIDISVLAGTDARTYKSYGKDPEIWKQWSIKKL